MVVAVPLSLLVQRNHEQVGAGELAQESARTLPTRDRIAQRASHRPQDRGLEQKLPYILGESSQNLLSQEGDDVAVAAAKRLDECMLVLLVLQGEGSEVDPRRPPFGTLEQNREVIGADAKPHLLVQQAIGFLLGHELVVIEHQYDSLGHLGELVYERGERRLDEPLPHGAHSQENICSELLFFWHNLAQRLYYVPPQPDRIVVLLVEGDPRKGHLGFFYLTPVG